MYPIDIIGIGQGREDLTQKHLDLIRECDVLVGGKRHLEMFDCPDKQKITVKADMNSVVEAIKDKINRHKIVVLASGDPLFYGIGSTLTRYFDKQYLTVHSNISSIAAAFAAIKEPWHDAKIISLHDKQKAFFSFGSLACEQKVAFLTNPQMNPQYIAAGLMKYDLYDFRFCVIEKLGDKDEEKITWIDNIDQVKNHTFLQPNIVILKKQEQENNHVSHETHIGMDDFAFKHSNGLITKSEIRSITLSKLKLTRKDHVLWDIGAGSGSVGIEASLQIPLGRVYAVEKHPGRICDIAHNIKKLNCSNVQIINTAFPEGMEELTRPDRIFIGGGGQSLEQIITVSAGKLAAFGIIVVNTVLLQNMEIALRLLKEKNFDPDVVQVQVSRSKTMPFGDRLEALNPVWIISGSKPETR
ncbi:bifunctional cobalt-precorrin-7 (C(5))-methyltransferase/cobalt-precorrin-6B (C(15))-methyltransferase [Desulfobacula toluolica]|uniref:CobL: precorrin-6Y C(5,15)-methyltransferase n=1 Tax=Desulfobacula toluolica (strain DSM 7467 / Tol2) TaxID=651182 RepID=K0NLV2_DESTT|nr:bifunctional cobalt-precorrin-7 (C(5))-methyltransferase/cobalt-precorrin-6B (C(15))-methyltransferase [Desulfobacula toluolica]CCK82496.1 CobL: precorrin-6Y C(5,15)-methyltransferase [Desulfobacula toluolica Tol2]